MIQRRLITKFIADSIDSDLSIPVGIGNWPPGVRIGWQGPANEPGSKYQPWAVLSPLTANSTSASGPLSEPEADWRLPYSVNVYGITAEQAEFTADLVRSSITKLKNVYVSTENNKYNIAQTWVTSIGGLLQIPQQDPPIWGQTDLFTVWVFKEL